LHLGDIRPIGNHELVRDPAVEEKARMTKYTREVLVQLFVGNHVRVAAVSVGGNVDRKDNLSH
jgi:hypothetical protein